MDVTADIPLTKYKSIHRFVMIQLKNDETYEVTVSMRLDLVSHMISQIYDLGFMTSQLLCVRTAVVLRTTILFNFAKTR